MELDWERARNNRIAQDQTAALARVEEKIAKALQSTQNLEKPKATVAKNSQEVRAQSVSTMDDSDIQKGIRNLLAGRPPRPTAQARFDAPETNKLRRRTGLDLVAMLEAHETFLQGGHSGKEPPYVPTALAGNPDDSDTSSEPTTPSRRPSPLPRRKRLSSEEEEDMSMSIFVKILASAFHQLKKEDEDGGRRIPLKAPETFDGSFSKFR